MVHINTKFRPHTKPFTQEKLRELNYKILPHLPYSPDIALSNYHLFRSLQHYMSVQIFDNQEVIKKDIENLIASKTTNYFSCGIENLVQ